MEELGCTTPFGPNKSNICTSQTESEAAMFLYESYFVKQEVKPCPRSCQVFSIKITLVRQALIFLASFSTMTISFNELVRNGTAYYRYTTLSLIADVGGLIALVCSLALLSFKFLECVAMLKNNRK